MKKLIFLTYLLLHVGNVVAQHDSTQNFETIVSKDIAVILQNIIAVTDSNKDYILVNYNGNPTYIEDSINQNQIRIRLKVENQYLGFNNNRLGNHDKDIELNVEIDRKPKDKSIPTLPIYPLKSIPTDNMWEIILEKNKDDTTTIKIVYITTCKTSLIQIQNAIKKVTTYNLNSILESGVITSKLIFEKQLLQEILEFKEPVVNDKPDINN